VDKLPNKKIDRNSPFHVIEFDILNNPFNLVESDSVFFVINDEFVYGSSFKTYDSLIIPQEFSDLYIRTDIYIKRAGSNSYRSLISKRLVYFSLDDVVGHLVFCPTNSKSENFFFLLDKELLR